MAAVAYLKLEGVPGDYFRCERYGLMSTKSCATNFRQAPTLSREGRLSGCVRCPIGAEHSGQPADAASPSRMMSCTRCRRDATEFKAAVGRVKMVRGGLHCVSCFNREREFLAGRNAKGSKPRLQLHAITVGLIDSGRMELTRLSVAKDRTEAALTVMRRGGPDLGVTWSSVGVLRAAAVEEETA